MCCLHCGIIVFVMDSSLFWCLFCDMLPQHLRPVWTFFLASFTFTLIFRRSVAIFPLSKPRAARFGFRSLPSTTGARLSQLVFLHRLPRRSTHVNNFCLSLPHLSTLLLLMFSDLLALAITCQELVDVEEVGENNARSQLLSAMDPVKPPPPHRVVLTPCCQCRSSPPPPLPPLSTPPPTPVASAWCHSTLSR